MLRVPFLIIVFDNIATDFMFHRQQTCVFCLSGKLQIKTYICHYFSLVVSPAVMYKKRIYAYQVVFACVFPANQPYFFYPTNSLVARLYLGHSCYSFHHDIAGHPFRNSAFHFEIFLTTIHLLMADSSVQNAHVGFEFHNCWS